MRLSIVTALLAILALVGPASAADQLLVEAESFDTHGGWKLDTQFIEIMGSPYLLAHGLGRPVDDATATVNFPAAGTYHVYVRTKDWVARWEAPGAPGKFNVSINGVKLQETFGTEGADWHWQYGGPVQVNDPKGVKLALHDLTGFGGRVDAIYFTTDKASLPPNEGAILPKWRRDLLGLPEKPIEKSGYDLVVVGGGYGGLGAAISAARQGIKVALIQNRPVLGGNGSSEVRVWAMGGTRRGKYPEVGGIVEEFMDRAKKSPGTYEEFGDAKKEAIVRAEENIDLFLNHHAYKVETENNRIVAVTAFSTRDSSEKRFTGRLFVDATGHGTIGYLAGADHTMQETGHLGMSNMWAWANADEPVEFPDLPWALQLKMNDFPYPRDFHGQWFWESGFDKHPLDDLEYTRDWNFRAVYGAFNAMKNRDGADKHPNAYLTWMAYIGGPRESRQILGDVVLTREDIENKRPFPDGTIPTTWSIDLHYPKKQYIHEKYPDDPFIAVAHHGRGVDRDHGYPVPYRTFYSRNIENLFMSGRCISVTHEALGTVRVMKTGGMIGEAVGKAAALCIKHDATPRDIYQAHWDEFDTLLKLPHHMRRDSLSGDFYTRENSVQLKPVGVEYIDPAKLSGVVVDDTAAVKTGAWQSGQGLKNYVGTHYLYIAGGSDAQAVFSFKVPKAGKYEVRFAHQPHENRTTDVPVTVSHAGGSTVVRMNQQKGPTIDNAFTSLGVFEFTPDSKGTVTVDAREAKGNVHADAVQVLPAK